MEGCDSGVGVDLDTGAVDAINDNRMDVNERVLDATKHPAWWTVYGATGLAVHSIATLAIGGPSCDGTDDATKDA